VRLPQWRVREESILPPEILLLGAKPSHEVKCFALGQFTPTMGLSYCASDALGRRSDHLHAG
jgi:hypothetical protein